MNSNSFETILVRLPNWVGDVIMATPTLRALRIAFPNSHIVALGKPWARELLDGHPSVNEIITFPFQRKEFQWSNQRTLLKMLAKTNAKWGLLLPNSIGSSLEFFLARIPNRVGYSTNGRGFFLNHAIERPKQHIHQVDYFLALLQCFGLKNSWGRELYMPVPEEKRLESEALWQQWSVTNSDVIVGLNPGAAWGASKRWLPEYFAAAGDLFQRELGARIVIFGGPEEVSLAQQISNAMQTQPINAAGKDNLRVLPALLARCNLLITNDTGPMHIAASQKVPQVVLFGPTDPAQTAYIDPITKVIRKELECSPCFQQQCPFGHHQCMTGISPAEVFQAGMELLKSRSQ